MAAFIEMMLGLIIMKWNCLHVEDCKQVRSYLLILLITLKKQIQLSRCKSPMLFVRPWFNWFKLSYFLAAITKFNIFKPGCSIRIFHTTLTEKINNMFFMRQQVWRYMYIWLLQFHGHTKIVPELHQTLDSGIVWILNSDNVTYH